MQDAGSAGRLTTPDAERLKFSHLCTHRYAWPNVPARPLKQEWPWQGPDTAPRGRNRPVGRALQQRHRPHRTREKPRAETVPLLYGHAELVSL